MLKLALDNCFGSKRWTEPEEWMRITADSGIRYAEAGADNECDPLYSDGEYLKEWIGKVRKASAETGVTVANLYSGHGTYATLGLAHPDRRNAEKMRISWIGGMLETAAELQCGLGFFCHAFPHSVLQDPERFRKAEEDLCDSLAEIAVRADGLGVPSVGVEQMYSPHQIPWTIPSAKKMLRGVREKSGKDFYLTIDTGHQSGQRRFLRPSIEEIDRASREYRTSGSMENLPWLGPDRAYEMLRAGESTEKIDLLLENYPHLFAERRDADPYEWLEELGAYSPIVHLQQTDGTRSAHLPFDKAGNRTGIIDPGRVAAALARSAARPEESGFPARCGNHFLTLELFSGTADYPVDILKRISESAFYWKRLLPGL